MRGTPGRTPPCGAPPAALAEEDSAADPRLECSDDRDPLDPCSLRLCLAEPDPSLLGGAPPLALPADDSSLLSICRFCYLSIGNTPPWDDFCIQRRCLALDCALAAAVAGAVAWDPAEIDAPEGASPVAPGLLGLYFDEEDALDGGCHLPLRAAIAGEGAGTYREPTPALRCGCLGR